MNLNEIFANFSIPFLKIKTTYCTFATIGIQYAFSE